MRLYTFSVNSIKKLSISPLKQTVSKSFPWVNAIENGEFNV